MGTGGQKIEFSYSKNFTKILCFYQFSRFFDDVHCAFVDITIPKPPNVVAVEQELQSIFDAKKHKGGIAHDNEFLLQLINPQTNEPFAAELSKKHTTLQISPVRVRYFLVYYNRSGIKPPPLNCITKRQRRPRKLMSLPTRSLSSTTLTTCRSLRI